MIRHCKNKKCKKEIIFEEYNDFYKNMGYCSYGCFRKYFDVAIIKIEK